MKITSVTKQEYFCFIYCQKLYIFGGVFFSMKAEDESNIEYLHNIYFYILM